MGCFRYKPHSWRHPTCTSRGLPGSRRMTYCPFLSVSLSLPSSFRPSVTHPDGMTPRPKRYPAKSSSRRKGRWGGRGDINSGRGRHVVSLSLIFAQRRRDFFPRPRAQGCSARADPHPSFLFSPSIPSPSSTVDRISVTLLSSSAPIFTAALWEDRINFEHALANASDLRRLDFASRVSNVSRKICSLSSLLH